MQIFFIGMPATNSSCPGLSRASTFFVPRERSWMAGTSPAMTMWKRLYVFEAEHEGAAGVNPFS